MKLNTAWSALALCSATVLAAPNANSPPSYGHPNTPTFYKGFDLSSLKILEDGGAVYKDTARGNKTRPVEDILGDGGMNTVRLRLWVNPTVPFDDGCKSSFPPPSVQ